jgi:protease YdgD
MNLPTCKRRWTRPLVTAALLIFGLGGTAAQAESWSATAGPDAERPRLVVDATYYPFSAMGKIQIAGQSFCGGTLVGPKLVITAGHCLWNNKRKRWWAPEDVHFVAGYQRSTFIAHGRGVRFLTPLTNEHKAPDQKSIVNDWALLELDRPIGNQVGWLGLSQESQRSITNRQGDGSQTPSPLFLAAYRSDRAHAMSLQSHCMITNLRVHGRVIYTDCQVVHGSSGSALVTFENGQFKVVGVVSARLRLRDRPTQTAVVTSWALTDPQGPDTDQVATYAPQWNEPWVREDTLRRGMDTLIAALSDQSVPEGKEAAVLEKLLRIGPQQDKIALPPMQFPELQKCRGDCAASGKLAPPDRP